MQFSYSSFDLKKRKGGGKVGGNDFVRRQAQNGRFSKPVLTLIDDGSIFCIENVMLLLMIAISFFASQSSLCVTFCSENIYESARKS